MKPICSIKLTKIHFAFSAWVLFVLFLAFNSAVAQESNPQLDSLLSLLDQAENDKQRLKLLNEVANASMGFNDLEGEKYADSALKLSRKLGDKASEIQSLYQKALYLSYGGDYDSAKYNCLLALQISTTHEDLRMKAIISNRLGYIYQKEGDLEGALKYFLLAMNGFEILEDQRGMAATANRIGIFYDVQEKRQTAKEYYDKALNYYVSIGDLREQSVVLNNIGVVLFEEGEYEAALEYYQNSLDIVRQEGLQWKLPGRLINIGKVYKALEDQKQSFRYYQLGLEKAVELGNKNMESYAYEQLGEASSDAGNYLQAVGHYLKALEIASEIQESTTVMDLNRRLSETYALLKNYELAFSHQQQHMALKDSLFNIEKSSEVARVQARYETATKEKEIILLKKEGEKKDILLYAFVLGTLLLIAIILLIVISYKKRNKANALLNAKNEEINRQKIADLLKDQQLKSVKDTLLGQEMERKRVAKDLHDGIGGTLAGIKLNLIKESDLSERKAFLIPIISSLDKACEEVRAVSHNLVPPIFFDSVFTDVVQDFMNAAFKGKDMEVDLELYPKAQLNSLSESMQIDIYRIIQELVNNIIKHAHATALSVYLTHHEHYLNLIVEDNGKGFEYINGGRGIGLRNIHERVKALKGNLHIDSKLNRGTSVNVDIPHDIEALAQ